VLVRAIRQVAVAAVEVTEGCWLDDQKIQRTEARAHGAD